MPLKMWKHSCRNGGTVWNGAPNGCGCGVVGVFDGWFNDRLESMTWYQKRYGLKPIGLHRPLADKLLAGATRSCPECSGRGYHDIGSGKAYRICKSCEGAGYPLIISAKDLATRRSDILAEYPTAAAPSDIQNPATGIALHDLAKNEMIVVLSQEK